MGWWASSSVDGPCSTKGDLNEFGLPRCGHVSGPVVVAEAGADEVLVKRLLKVSRAGPYDLESVAGPTRDALTVAPLDKRALRRPSFGWNSAMPPP